MFGPHTCTHVPADHRRVDRRTANRISNSRVHKIFSAVEKLCCGASTLVGCGIAEMPQPCVVGCRNRQQDLPQPGANFGSSRCVCLFSVVAASGCGTLTGPDRRSRPSVGLTPLHFVTGCPRNITASLATDLPVLLFVAALELPLRRPGLLEDSTTMFSTATNQRTPYRALWRLLTLIITVIGTIGVTASSSLAFTAVTARSSSGHSMVVGPETRVGVTNHFSGSSSARLTTIQPACVGENGPGYDRITLVSCVATNTPKRVPKSLGAAAADDLTGNVGTIAERTGATSRQVRDAIHAVKRNLPRGGPIRNPDVVVDLRSGEVFPVLPTGLGDSIGNIFDHLPDLG
jgi:hypothetical protein